MAEQVPSIGRIVHFVATNGAHVPADICGTWDDGRVNLFVKDSTVGRAYFEYSVPFEPTGTAPGSCHWPEYVPAKGEAAF
jgi:hypothetical protein